MIKLIYFIFFIFSITFASRDYDNIFSIKSSPKNIAIGNLHAPSTNISGIFDSPIFDSLIL